MAAVAVAGEEEGRNFFGLEVDGDGRGDRSGRGRSGGIGGRVGYGGTGSR